MTDPHDDDEHFDDLEPCPECGDGEYVPDENGWICPTCDAQWHWDEDEDEDPWDLHDYEGESPESLRNWYNGRVL